jgi:hypothetical protein
LPNDLLLSYRNLVPLRKFQMAPILRFLVPSGLKKKEPSHVLLCLSETEALHSHKMCAEISSSVPHFLQMGSLHSLIIYKCLLKVLCPVRRPITTLDCAQLKDSSRAPVARLGLEINYRSFLSVLQGPRHNSKC